MNQAEKKKKNTHTLIITFCSGQPHNVAVFIMSPHSWTVLGFKPAGRFFCVDVLSLCGFPLGASSHSPETRRLIGDSKLPVGVNVSMNGCLCPWVSAVINWLSVQAIPRLSPNICPDWLQPPPPHNPPKDIINIWMDGWMHRSCIHVENT